jgi:hypothetical protein
MKPPRLAAAKRIWVRFLVGWPEHIQQNEVSSQRLYAGPNASRSFEDATGLPRGGSRSQLNSGGGETPRDEPMASSKLFEGHGLTNRL